MIVTHLALRSITTYLKNPPMDRYRVYWSLADKCSGTGLLVKRSIAAPVLSYSLSSGAGAGASGGGGGDGGGGAGGRGGGGAASAPGGQQSQARAKPPQALPHDDEGRVILAEFPGFVLLNTYATHNTQGREDAVVVGGFSGGGGGGGGAGRGKGRGGFNRGGSEGGGGGEGGGSGFQRRRAWDKRLADFFGGRGVGSKPVLWCGDLNATRDERDVTDPRFFADAILDVAKGMPLDPGVRLCGGGARLIACGFGARNAPLHIRVVTHGPKGKEKRL